MGIRVEMSIHYSRLFVRDDQEGGPWLETIETEVPFDCRCDTVKTPPPPSGSKAQRNQRMFNFAAIRHQCMVTFPYD